MKSITLKFSTFHV